MARAVAGNKLVERGFKAPDSVWAVIVSVVERAAPDGVIVEGPNAQAAPEGNPVHANVTAPLKPFSGVTINFAVPCAADLTTSVPGVTETEKSGKLMV